MAEALERLSLNHENKTDHLICASTLLGIDQEFETAFLKKLILWKIRQPSNALDILLSMKCVELVDEEPTPRGTIRTWKRTFDPRDDAKEKCSGCKRKTCLIKQAA